MRAVAGGTARAGTRGTWAACAVMSTARAHAPRVVVPNVELPKGWSSDRVTVYFVLPVGYPSAQPDCFWTEATLRLEDGRTPQNTGLQQIPGTSEQLLWFSWHVQTWSPNEGIVKLIRFAHADP